MTRLLAFASLFALVLAAGCNNGLDHDSAVKVTNSALSGTIAADVHVMTAGMSSGIVDVTLTDAAGTGTAHVTGSVTKTGDMVTTQINVVLNHWTDGESQVTVDGTLHENGTFSAPLPLTGTVQLSGALTASGSVTGSVDFDLTGSYSPTGFSVTGQVGGQSIDATLKVAL